jgi:hypothetical protein
MKLPEQYTEVSKHLVAGAWTVAVFSRVSHTHCFKNPLTKNLDVWLIPAQTLMTLCLLQYDDLPAVLAVDNHLSIPS